VASEKASRKPPSGVSDARCTPGVVIESDAINTLLELKLQLIKMTKLVACYQLYGARCTRLSNVAQNEASKTVFSRQNFWALIQQGPAAGSSTFKANFTTIVCSEKHGFYQHRVLWFYGYPGAVHQHEICSFRAVKAKFRRRGPVDCHACV